MRRRTLILLFSLLFIPGIFSYCWGQLEPQLTMYMFNMYGFNPACAGLGKDIGVSVSHRQQNYGFPAGSGDDKTTVFPVTTLLLGEMPIKLLKGGVGLSISSDKIAQFSDVNVKLGYSYHLETSLGRIGLGLQLGFIDKKLDFSQLKPEETSDPFFNNKSLISGFYTDFSVGALLQSNRDFYVGVSMAQVITSYKEDLHMTSTRLVFFQAGYNFSFATLPDFEFTPSVFLKTDLHGAFQADISALTTYRRKIFGGLSFRWGDAISIIAGVNIKELKIGVAYDASVSKMTKGSKVGGSFELFAKYSFQLEVDRKYTNYKNSRYL